MTAKIILHKLLFWAALSLFALSAYSCSEPASPFGQTDITLTALDASCTEVWLSIKSSVDGEDDNRNFYYTLHRGDSLLASFTIAPADTLITDSLLIPNNLYSYRLEVRNRQNSLIKEILLDVPTLAPSSSDFTWQSWSFGDDILYSSLYDVEIIDENNIWVVGKIYIPDTNNSGSQKYYNAAHWNGYEWSFKRIFYNNTVGWGLTCLTVDNHGKLWFAGLVSYQNNMFIEYPVPGIFIGWSKKDFISLKDNQLMLVGRGGRIVKYINGEWYNIQPGIEFDSLEFTLKKVTQSKYYNEVFVCGLSNDYSYSALLQVKDDKAEVIWDANYIEQKPPYRSIRSITTVDKDLIIVSTSGIWRKKLFSKNMEKFIAKHPTWFVEDTEAIASNDFITAGHRFEISHFNGINLKRIYMDNHSSIVYGADYKNNIIVAVGDEFIDRSTKAKVLIGKRN